MNTFTLRELIEWKLVEYMPLWQWITQIFVPTVLGSFS